MQFREIVASLYPWDLADEGVEQCLDNLQGRACCNAVYLIGLMHHEKRPLTDYYYPHNPRRRYYLPEDSRVYWRPDPSRWAGARIQPLVTERDFLRANDWLDVLVRAARSRGLKTGVEISHTPLDKARASGALADCIQQDVYGNRLGQYLCPNHPDVRAYLLNLFADVARYDVDMIQTCMLLFAPGRADVGRPELNRLIGIFAGGCFCDHCGRAAAARGWDWDAIKNRARWLVDIIRQADPPSFYEHQLLRGSNVTPEGLLLEEPLLYQWLRLRVETVTALFQAIRGAIKDVRPAVDFRYNHHTTYPEGVGLDLRALAAHLDSIRSSDYSEQRGSTEAMSQKRQTLLRMRRAVGDLPLISAIGVRPRATPELIRLGIRISAECGADGISLGHYDGAWWHHLDAVRNGLREAEVDIPWM